MFSVDEFRRLRAEFFHIGDKVEQAYAFIAQ